mmetsp:Transcript_8240/g.12313  ORF Transcript_8240/g.12313 Transcript_8240/m.12313 type:complete len:208 (+) Transcript_8240:1392-2015(+)
MLSIGSMVLPSFGNRVLFPYKAIVLSCNSDLAVDRLFESSNLTLPSWDRSSVSLGGVSSRSLPLSECILLPRRPGTSSARLLRSSPFLSSKSSSIVSGALVPLNPLKSTCSAAGFGTTSYCVSSPAPSSPSPDGIPFIQISSSLSVDSSSFSDNLSFKSPFSTSLLPSASWLESPSSCEDSKCGIASSSPSPSHFFSSTKAADSPCS